MKKIDEIYELFSSFNQTNPGYFEDQQIAQLEILKSVIANDSVASDIKLQILFETCKQLLCYIDEKISTKKLAGLFTAKQLEVAEESRYKSRTSQFFSSQFVAVKETLKIGHDNILADKVMGALFLDAHDEYFKIKVHRYLEEYKRLEPTQQQINLQTINALQTLMREPLTAQEAYQQIISKIEESPQLKKIIDAEYDLYKQYWIPQVIAGRDSKIKKTARREAVIEELTDIDSKEMKLNITEKSLSKLGIDSTIINGVIQNSKNKSDDDILSDLKTIFSKSTDIDNKKMEAIKTYMKEYQELQNAKAATPSDEPPSSSPVQKQ